LINVGPEALPEANKLGNHAVIKFVPVNPACTEIRVLMRDAGSGALGSVTISTQAFLSVAGAALPGPQSRQSASLDFVAGAGPAGLREKTAVNAQRLAADEGSVVAEQELDGRGDVIGRANAAQWGKAGP
jgi:hypothetical protein